MIKRVLTVLLIEDSPEYAELVQRWLAASTDTEFVLQWTESLISGLNRLAKGGVDVILLDLGLPDSEGMRTFTTARMHASSLPIIILSGADTESLALQMVQQGAQDYLVKSACTSASLIKSLQFAVGRSAKQIAASGAGADHGTVIGILGAKGGAGATTFGCNLAAELRRHSSLPTLIADLDLGAGLVSFLMNTEARASILDVVTNLDQLDAEYWKGLVARDPGGVDILRSPNVLAVEQSDIEKMVHVLSLIRAMYRWTVLDFGRLSAVSLALLDKLNELYLVTRVSVPALYEAKRTVGALLEAGFDPDRLRLVVNQGWPTQEFSRHELSRMFGIPVSVTLPDAQQELHEVCTQGVALPAGSPYRFEITALARKLAGLPEEAAGSRVAQLRSFADRFLRHKEDAAVTSQVRYQSR